eukprot:TRINITY_DN1253_c1_g1_i6.p1 TRINITY_DN1253_c1_g1~~TRINITY_DN1253_c1_g1_i6.p1  ORF type:complete len:188 (-),score=63.98 TRINITY_DN1253_c1_g1_i6:57-620(-)
MNNIVCCSLPLLRVPAEQFREVLGCVLHTVLFSRIVSSMAPTEGYIEALDFVFSKTADPAVDRKVEAAVKACEVRKDKPSVVSLFFLEPQLKQSQWGLGFSMRKPAYFEKWEISLQAVDAQLTGSYADTLRKELRAVLLKVIDHVATNKSHLPEFTLGAFSEVAFQFEIETAAVASDNLLKRFLNVI